MNIEKLNLGLGVICLLLHLLQLDGLVEQVLGADVVSRFGRLDFLLKCPDLQVVKTHTVNCVKIMPH